ncbi:MAG TPA: hypothetical protein PLW57_02755, partial [Sphaerochaeta sp.]|nr:hypothetical protein [Sphaerochaeta sp.]
MKNEITATPKEESREEKKPFLAMWNSLNHYTTLASPVAPKQARFHGPEQGDANTLLEEGEEDGNAHIPIVEWSVEDVL